MTSLDHRKEELQKIFQKFDVDRNNSVSYDEARAVMQDFKFTQTDAEIRTLMMGFDKNQDGQLQFDEFVHFWQALGGKVPAKQ